VTFAYGDPLNQPTSIMMGYFNISMGGSRYSLPSYSALKPP
jgi:hypothetical protein